MNMNNINTGGLLFLRATNFAKRAKALLSRKLFSRINIFDTGHHLYDYD